MKLAVFACLAMFAAVCAAKSATNQETIDLIKRLLESRAGTKKETPHFKNVEVLKSKELMSKLRNLKNTKTKTISHRHVTAECADAHIELEDTLGDVEEGIIMYPDALKSILPTSRRSSKQGGACSFHIHPDSDHFYVVFANVNFTGDVYPACGEDGLGHLIFYEGDSDESPELGRLCGQHEFAFIPRSPELFITFTPDAESNVEFFIYYEILSKESILESVDLGEDEPAGHTGDFPDPPAPVDPHAQPPVKRSG